MMNAVGAMTLDPLDDDCVRRVLLAFSVNGRRTMTSGEVMAASGMSRAPDIFTQVTDRLVARGWLRRGIAQIGAWRVPVFTATSEAPSVVMDAVKIRHRLKTRDENLPTRLLLLPPLEELLVA